MQVDVLFIFATVAFFIWSIRSIFYFVHEWQSLSSRRVGIRQSFAYLLRYFISPLSLITWIAIIFSIYVNVSDFPLRYDHYLILGLFIIKAGVTLNEVSRRKLRLPQFDSKIIVICSLAIILTAAVFSFPLSERYLWLLLLDRLLVIFVAFPIFLVLFPSELIDDLLIKRAIKKLRSYKKLKTVLLIGDDANKIGFFLEQLLQKQKEVVFVNDPFTRLSSISSAISHQVTENTDYLLVAYRNNSLSSLETILREVHFSAIIFSQAESKKMVQKMSAIVSNYLTPQIQLYIDTLYSSREEFQKKKKNIFTFALKPVKELATLSHISTQQKKDKLLVKLLFKEEEIVVQVPLIGVKNSEYLIPVILYSLQIGIKKETSLKTLSTVNPLPGEFVEHRLQSGVTLVDATGVHEKSLIRQGLNYLKLYRKQKVIVFGIEDELTKADVLEFKSELSYATTILVTGQKHQLLLRRLMRVGTDKVEVRAISNENIPRFIRDRLGRDDLILFLGENVADVVESMLLSSSTSK